MVYSRKLFLELALLWYVYINEITKAYLRFL